MADKKKSFPTQLRLVGKNIYLRPATAEDVANTYHWYLQSDPTLMSSTPFPFMTASEAAERYKKREQTPNEQLFVVVPKKGKAPVGLIRFFDHNSLNRSSEIDLLIDPEERRKGYARDALDTLCDFLFYARDLNKLHARTSSLNKGAIALMDKAGFKRDGVLRLEYFHEGEFHDGLIFSLLRYEFER
jgi:diamine N-acetyltransferase